MKRLALFNRIVYTQSVISHAAIPESLRQEAAGGQWPYLAARRKHTFV